MAGEWIKVQNATPDKPEVMRVARILGIDRDAVFGKLVRLWAWVDQHSEDGTVDGVVDADVDALMSCIGFCDALQQVGWMHCDAQEERITIPNFGRHNGESAKKRVLKSERQARWRQSRDAEVDASVDAAPSTAATTREEKRREEVITPLPPSGDAYTSEFNAFWETYPNRKNKAQAFKAWKKLSPEQRQLAREDSARRPTADPDWLKDAGQYVPMASTYLNGKRWEDDWQAAPQQGRARREL